MRVLFLDQSGKLGGAELSLLDVASAYGGQGQVVLLQDGPFRTALESRQVPVTVLDSQLQVQQRSGVIAGLASLGQLLPLARRVARLAASYDVIYTNTSKAFVVGAMASGLSRKPLVHHLRDILSREHFSPVNQGLLVMLANTCAAHVIANSQATREAFLAAGGRRDRVSVIYNGFDPEAYAPRPDEPELRSQLRLQNKFVVGHFSRLAPWKGQHVLLEAVAQCPEVAVLLVGDALFGEQAYVEQLHRQVETLHLQDRVHFLGFRSDVPALMRACDLVAHTSTAPEPFGRVIVEATLCRRPVIAAAAGGAVELVEHGHTGLLCPPEDAPQLGALIRRCHQQPEYRAQLAAAGYHHSRKQFSLAATQAQIHQRLEQVCACP